MHDTTPSLPALTADLLLLHAPAVYDFRERGDIYFPFLGTSGDVPITPLYEYFPVGFKTLERHLGGQGHTVRLVNLSTVLLRYPALDVETVIGALDVRLLGIDLHWMVHVQGALAVAELVRRVKPGIPIVFGGISSTYYARELMEYPFIDMVMRGYDTHEPMSRLLDCLRDGRAPGEVLNLMWKDASGKVHDNSFSHLPDTFACAIDWSRQPGEAEGQTLPILEFLSTQNAGCAYNCGWCGGSRDAFRRIFGKSKAMARKPVGEVRRELASMRSVSGTNRYHFYSVGSYNETRERMSDFLDQVAGADLRSVSYEQYHLTPDDTLKHMARANPNTLITLSPESHDPRVARLAGRGVYSNEEMEAWIYRALEAGIREIDIWYFIGMPEQDERSVYENVDYCHSLLQRFKGLRVNPMLCPMIPFLDPGSTFFTEPDAHGYTVFHRTVEEHRRAMERASLLNRINYETRWLSRAQLVDTGFRAVRALMQAKADEGFLPRGLVGDYVARIDDALEFIPRVHEADCIQDETVRRRELSALGPEILLRNRQLFDGAVMNQAFPVNRAIGGRWFDELGWTAGDLEALQARHTPA